MGVAPLRQRDQIALGREAEHLVLVDGELGMLVKFLRAVAALEQIHHVAQPFVGFRSLLVMLVDIFAVTPVCGHPAFGDIVHFLGADLHFDALVFGADHGGVQRAIAVGFWQ